MYTAFDFIEEVAVAIFSTIQVDGDSFLHTTYQVSFFLSSDCRRVQTQADEMRQLLLKVKGSALQ